MCVWECGTVKVPPGGNSRLAFWGTTVINVPVAHRYTSTQATKAHTGTHGGSSSVCMNVLVTFFLILFTVSDGADYREELVSVFFVTEAFLHLNKTRGWCVISYLRGLIFWQHSSWVNCSTVTGFHLQMSSAEPLVDFKWVKYSLSPLLSCKKTQTKED